MRQGEFWTNHEIEGKSAAVLVKGYIDEKQGVGFYKLKHDFWMDEWHAIDLKSGLSIANAGYRKVAERKMLERWNEVIELKKEEKYQKACAEFEEAIKVAEINNCDRN